MHLGGDPVGLVLGQAAVRVPAAVGGRRQQVGERVDVGGGPGVELVVPARGQVGPVVRDVPAGVGIGRDDGVAAVGCELDGHGVPLVVDSGRGRGATAAVSPGPRGPTAAARPWRWRRPGRGAARPARVEVVADDEPAVLHPLDREPPELVEVDHVGRTAGGGQGRLELGEGGARCRRAGPHPGQLGGPVALGLPQPGLEQAARRVEDGGPQLRPLGQELVGQGLGEAADRRLGRGVDRGVGHRCDAAVARRRGHHHARLARGDHPRDEGQDAVGRAEDVDPEAPAPVVGLLLPRVAAAARGDPGVVPQDVAGTELVVDGVGQRLDARRRPTRRSPRPGRRPGRTARPRCARAPAPRCRRSPPGRPRRAGRRRCPGRCRPPRRSPPPPCPTDRPRRSPRSRVGARPDRCPLMVAHARPPPSRTVRRSDAGAARDAGRTT